MLEVRRPLASTWSRMQKRTKIITASIVAGALVLGATAAIAGPIVYRDLIVGEADAAPRVTASPSSSSDADAAVPTDLSGEWVVADGSFAGYRVDEVLNGTDVTVTGRTDEVDGTLTVDALTLRSAEFTVDVASIETDSANRDDYFRTTALRTDEFPTATFELTEAISVAEAPSVGDVHQVTATGELTIAGVTNPVTFELEAVLDGTTGQVAGSIPITFADYGVEAPNLGFVSVEPDGFVEFSLALERG